MATVQIPVARRAPDKLFVDGAWLDAAGGRTFPVYNPSDGEVIAEVAEASAADVDMAVDAARRAFEDPLWRRMDAADRGKILWRLADAIEARSEELLRLEVINNGKPIREAKFDLQEVIDVFRYYAGWTTKLQGDTLPVRGNVLNYTLREPVGVVAAIIPWNFPLEMAAWKVAPALACGNTVVLKPAEQTPLTALELAAIADEVGLPSGVLNVVPGFGETAGAALVGHRGVDKVAFTGSTVVGKTIAREAAETLKLISLELGGKSPNIVLADADLEAASRGAFSAVFYNAGQTCTAGSRLLVHESVKEELVARLVKRAQSMEAGEPLDPRRRFGPMISEKQMRRVLGYIERGKDEGAELLVGGARLPFGGAERGYWVAPTIFDRVSPDAAIAQEEIFGPVLAVLPYSNEEEAIELANRTMYGLAAAVWTRDVKKAHRIARDLQAGTVWINMYHPLDPASPFGGTKQSGYGRELGAYALDLYTQIKSVWVDLS
jgi:acyl-CoA reductase-like NAD-dependent aldehyde dehydrogenase